MVFIRKHLYTNDGTINDELLRKNVVIYGCGNDGKKLIKELQRQNVIIEALFDSNPDIWGKRIEGIEVKPIQELYNFQECNIALAFFLWPDVIGRVQEIFDDVYVDYPYEEESNNKCIICKGNCVERKAHFAPFIVERMFKGVDFKTKLIKCTSCNTYFSLYRPSDEEMNNLYFGYRDEEYIRVRCKTEQYNRNIYYNDTIESVRRKEIEIFLGEEFDYGSIKYLLDYGGDEGQFIPLKFENAEKYVYEISGNKTRKGIYAINEFDDISNYNWNFIMCCHVLEHVSDPLMILDKIINSLNKGFFYLELPYETFVNSYSDVEINEHINFFTMESIEQIAKIYKIKIKKKQIKNNVLRALYEKDMENDKGRI